MSQAQQQNEIDQACRYEVRFGNLEEISHPQIIFRPEFGRLLLSAVESGAALTQEAVSAVFPDLAWDW